MRIFNYLDKDDDGVIGFDDFTELSVEKRHNMVPVQKDINPINIKRKLSLKPILDIRESMNRKATLDNHVSLKKDPLRKLKIAPRYNKYEERQKDRAATMADLISNSYEKAYLDDSILREEEYKKRQVNEIRKRVRNSIDSRMVGARGRNQRSDEWDHMKRRNTLAADTPSVRASDLFREKQGRLKREQERGDGSRSFVSRNSILWKSAVGKPSKRLKKIL